MRTRDFILPSLTAFVVSSLLLFLSCANQSRSDKEGLDELAEEVAETVGDELEGAEGGMENFSDDEEGFGSEDLGELGGEDELGLPSEEELAQAADNTTAEEALPVDDNLEETFTEGDMGGDDLGDDVLGLPSDAELAQAEKLEEAAKAESSFEEEMGDENFESSGFDSGSGSSSSAVSTWSGQSRIPTIPEEAFSKKGANLNRYYFLRLDDSPTSVSQLLYGSSSHTSKLKAWNGGRWTPGKVVYYQSQQNQNDQRMRSFYQERNISPQEYQIRRGDILSLIAKQQLGHIMSWKEIAVVNGLGSADAIEPGQRIAIYPADLSGGSNASSGYSDSYQQSVEAVTPSQPSIPQETPNKPAIQADSPLQFSPPPSVKNQVKRVSRRSRRKSRGFSISKIIRQNMFFIIVGSGILLLLGALVVVNKKKRGRPTEDFNDDIFGDQMKK